MAKESISLEMAISGANAVKKDINEVKDSLKTLDKHLDYVEKSFKETGDQEKYMDEKSKDLHGRLEALQGIVDKAKEALAKMESAGVTPNTKAYQDMQRAMLDAQTQMIDTRDQLKSIGESAGDASKDAQGMNDELAKVGQGVGWDNVAEGIGKITDKLESGAKAAINFGKKIAQSAMTSTQWADEIITEATKYGTDEETIQKMRNVAAFIDTDAETILNAKARLAKNKDTLADTLGVNADGKTVDEAFWAAGEAIMAMTDEFEKEEAAQKVFGKGWKELVPLFTAGQEEYNRLMGEQNVLTIEQVKALGEADDAFNRMKQQVELMKNQFWAENADKIVELGQWLIDNKDSVVAALEAMAVAFGALKLAEVAANIGKVVSGFQTLGWLGGGSGGSGPSAPTGGTGGTGGGFSGLWGKLKDWGGLLGLGAIVSGFEWSGDRRNNHADQVRGTESYLGAQSAGAEELLVNYLRAMQAQSGLTWMEPAEEVEAITQAAAKAYDELMGTQGGAEALSAYKDWRQENSYGSDYWEIPETLDKMTKAAEELSGDSDDQRQSNTEMTQAANGMKGLPAETATAVANALSGMKVVIDGAQLTAVVGQVMANLVQANFQ